MLQPEPEGGYTALVPALPGCVAYGRTVDEAREMAKDALSAYIASLRHKDPMPTEDKLVASLGLEYAINNSSNEDPLLSLRGSGKNLWADEHADDYVRRLREGWE
jgi:antitoxin HicB